MSALHKGMTAYFEYDLTELVSNPFSIDTPFGKPKTVSRGNEFAQRDSIETERDQLLEALKCFVRATDTAAEFGLSLPTAVRVNASESRAMIAKIEGEQS